MGRQRARSREDKQERKRQLLDAAQQVFLQRGYDGASVAAIARRAEVAKGTLFLYFPGKEALFLELLREQLERWLAQVDRRLMEHEGGFTPEELAQLFAGTLAGHPLLQRLLPLLPGVLERGVDEGTLADFKGWLLRRVGATGTRLETRAPWACATGGLRLMMRVHALFLGARLSSEVGPVAERVLNREELHPLRQDGARELNHLLEVYLRGLYAPDT